ncbi:sodium:solute symporter [Laceyella putida]|uniref:Sodium:solute symporter n=1 Tax=Laceyella putida TaxID=110101 RepID=A0ABW2RK67_9BACL
MHWLDMAILMLYFLIMVVIGIIGSRKVGSKEEYALAGRNLGLVIYCSCLVAVIIGGAATIGTAKLGYQFGISGVWLVVMLGIGIMLLGLIFGNYFSKLRITTISEFLGQRYNEQTRFFSAIVSIIYTLMVTVTQIIGMGAIIHAILGWDMTLSMLVGGGVALFYTMLGGMWSVTMTDVVQFIVMTVGIFAVMLPLSLSHVGGMQALMNHVPATHWQLSAIGFKQIFQYFLLYCLGMVVSQDILQRVFTAKNARVSKQGAIFAGVYSIAWAIALSLIGMCAALLLPRLDNPQNAFASLADMILPPGLLGLVLAAVCAALMSNASGSLLASSTLLIQDILKPTWMKDWEERKLLLLSKGVTLLIGLIAMVFAIRIQDVLVALDIAYAILSGAIFIPIVLGILWKGVTAKAGFYAVIAGTIVVIGGLIIEGPTSTNAIMYGMGAGLLVIVGGSWLGKVKSSSEVPVQNRD